MDRKLNFLIRGKAELTRKRLQIDDLLKRAKKGEHQANKKLYQEFGIRLYSPEEVEKYVKKKLKTEVVEGLPTRVRAMVAPKTTTKRRSRQEVKKHKISFSKNAFYHSGRS